MDQRSAPRSKSSRSVSAGATYQVPIEVRPERRQTLGLRWLTTYARARSEKTMKERLAGEIMDAANSLGNASRSARTPTRWLSPIRRSLTTAGNKEKQYA